MGRKKKEEEVPLLVPDVGGEVQAEKKPRKKRERKVKEEPVAVIAETREPVVAGSLLNEDLRLKAEDWARECGLVGELDITEVVKVNYRKFGHGFSVTLKEKGGKERLATARFTSEAARSYWSMDGKVVL